MQFFKIKRTNVILKTKLGNKNEIDFIVADKVNIIKHKSHKQTLCAI